ncbi:MAG: malate synthase A [Acidimicrobiia bacterium]
MGLELHAPAIEGVDEILTPATLAFLEALHREFDGRRLSLLGARRQRQLTIDAGERPDFLRETAAVRADSSWRIAALPRDLQDRRVEITGPVDRKMIINALNSGANVFMADFEDSNTPTWSNCIDGQRNLRDAVNRTISFESSSGGNTRSYRLNDVTATLMVRPRGWHLSEKHVLVDGAPMSGSLFDFGVYFFTNVRALVARGTAPYFYLPKMESHLEARLWNDVFVFAQEFAGVPQGTIRATVLIETILAAFEMDEILYELRSHSAGLNCGRWDYIFSVIKKFRADPSFVLGDRHLLTMTTTFMRSYSLLAIRTCHRRGAPAIGGMAAQIPIKGDDAANEAALAKVRADKQREATDGHDGTWVAHPGLVAIAREEFDKAMPTPNQIETRLRSDVSVAAADLLAFEPDGPITEDGLRTALNIALQYLGSWLAGTGCVPIFNLMEDAATAEISRGLVWQWVHSPRGVLADGRVVDAALVREVLTEELAKVNAAFGDAGRYDLAAKLVDDLVTGDEFPEFLTLGAYDLID